MRNFILGFILALLLAGAGYWVVTTKPFGSPETAKTQRLRDITARCTRPTFRINRATARFAG